MWIIGCGSIGRRVATHYLGRGEPVRGLVRTPASALALERSGIPALALDLDTDDLGPLTTGGERLFHFAPPPASGRQDPWTQRLADAFDRQGNPARVVYISTTGVYGDCAGDWIDEEHPVNPSTDRAWRRWDAEQTLRDWSRRSGVDLVILRVAGIYGPGALPLERIREGLPLVRPEDAPYTNRIHADDLVAVCVAAMEQGHEGGCYNVSDGHPSTMTDYFFRVADAARLPRPPTLPLAEATGHLSAGMLSYLRESRRLSNQRMLRELGVTLLYPTLAEGLRACFGTPIAGH